MGSVNFNSLLRSAIIVGALVVAILMGSFLAQAGSLLPIFAVGGIIMVALTAAFPAWLFLICVVLCLLTGRSGLGFGYWELTALALICRWASTVPFTGALFGNITGKFTFICISGFTLILLMHGIPAILGVGETAGRRLALMAIAALGFSYLLLSGKLDMSRRSLLPWFGLLPGIIAAGFDMINILIPAALPLTMFLYDGQNWELVAQYSGANVSLLRISGLRELGLGIAFLALTYFATERRLRISSFLLQVLSTLAGTALIILAGYRNYVLRIGLAVFIAAYHRSKTWLLATCISAIFVVGGLIYFHNNVVSLPLTAQRALSFLPGDWDWRTKSDADHGYGWRADIRQIYFTQIFPGSWLLGRGLQYEERAESMQWMAGSGSYSVDYFVMVQGYHSGLVSSLDFVGVLGTLFLVMGSLRAFWNCSVILRSRESAERWHLWVALMFITSSAVFWYTGFFERIFPFFAVFMCLLELAKSELADGRHPIDGRDSETADYETENDALV